MADTLEKIKSLPAELREQILKEYIKIKTRERADLGWRRLNHLINEAPFCDHEQQISNILFCHSCCYYHICGLCKRNGVVHFLCEPIYCDYKYEDVDTTFFKFEYETLAQQLNRLRLQE